MQKKLTLSLCLKKSLIDLSLFRGKEKVLGKCDPIFQFSDPNNEKSIDKAQNFLINSLGNNLGSIERIQINNDNKQFKSLLNFLKPHLAKNTNITPVNLTNTLVEFVLKKRKNTNFVIFNFDENVSEVYFLIEDKFKISAISVDLSFDEALNKMSSYLNPQENMKDFQIDKEGLFSSWQIFDQRLVNSFRLNQTKGYSNYDFSFLPTLKKFNNHIFLKEGFKKRTYSYKNPLNAADKMILYEKFFSETMLEINSKIDSLLGSMDEKIKNNCYYVLWGESFRSEAFKDSIEYLCQSHKLSCEKSIKPHEYSAIINTVANTEQKNHPITELENIKLYDLAHVSLINL